MLFTFNKGDIIGSEASSIIYINLIASLSFRKPIRMLAFHRGGSSAKAMQDGL
jgi:hypothetical protein